MSGPVSVGGGSIRGGSMPGAAVRGASLGLAAALALASGTALAACAPIPATEVIVYLSADPDLRARATRLHVVIESQEGEMVLDHDEALDGSVAELARIPVIPRDGDASRLFVVRASLHDGGAELATIAATIRFRQDALTEARLRFERACASIACGDGQTCVGGTCVGSCFDPTPLAPVRPAIARCGSCERCVGGECEPVADGAACGCPGDACASGTCVVSRPVSGLVVGDDHTCASTEDWDVYCWGANDEGQLGTGTIGEPATSAVPGHVLHPTGTWLSTLVGGSSGTCALLGDGHWWCWGSNWFGQFGNGTAGLEPSPTEISGPEIVELSGSSHFCGVDRDGALWCWGYNERRQLGTISEEAEVHTPARAAIDLDIATFDADGLHTCVVTADDELWCWGYNNSDELGIGERIETSAVPVRPGCGASQSGTCWSDWSRVATGEFHTCAIRRDGSLWCWGGNGGGSLGIGTSGAGESVPRAVAPGTQWSFVEAGYRNTCAIQIDGSLWCWGSGTSGEIGDGELELRTAPTRVADPPAGTRWQSVDLSGTHDGAHVCGVRSDRSLWCWGRNESGQSGAPDVDVVATPRRVCIPAR